MDVDRQLWWAVNWPYMALWGLTALALCAVLGALIVAWQARGRGRGADVPGMIVYLNEQRVTDIYQVGGYGDAITKEVVDEVGVTKDNKFVLGGLELALEAVRTSGRKLIKTYLETYGAVPAVGVVLRGLEAAHGVVHIDLHEPSVVRNTALLRAFPDASGTPVTADRLRRVKGYVSVTGEFRVTGGAPGEVVLTAVIGPAADPEGAPRVRVPCDAGGVRDPSLLEDTADPFYARCLGKVQSWQDDRQELLVRPIALFQ